MYFDFTFCFFFIKIPELEKKVTRDPSSRRKDLRQRINSALQIFPFLLNLNLKPLYSSRGGSTTRAEPLTKNPIPEARRLDPLYK